VVTNNKKKKKKIDRSDYNEKRMSNSLKVDSYPAIRDKETFEDTYKE
jgi:hypothetical protein